MAARRRAPAGLLPAAHPVRFVAVMRLNWIFSEDRNSQVGDFRNLPFELITRSRVTFYRVDCQLEYVDGVYVARIHLVSRVVE